MSNEERCLQKLNNVKERFLSRLYKIYYMALARADRVLKLAGNPTDQLMENVTDIDEIVNDADELVYDYTRTQASDWTEDVTHGYDWAREAAEYLAASRLCNEFHDINQKADMYDKKGMEKLKTLRQIGYGTLDGDNPTFTSVVTSYKTIPGTTTTMRPLRYRSANAFGGEYD